MPFLVYYVAETAFGDFQMSGVLAVVSLGLVFASPWGQVRVDPTVAHFLHEFWGMVGHLVNTIIFVLAGALIIIKIGQSYTSDFWTDLPNGLLVYLLLTLFRGAVMFGVIPIFRSGQYGYDWRDALVITWGGLRGAVGLALAAAVSSDAEILDCGESPNARFCITGGARLKQVAFI